MLYTVLRRTKCENSSLANKSHKNQVYNIVSSCRYEHQEMGQIASGKRGSLALTVSGYNCTVHCTVHFDFFMFGLESPF
jgi:hypothetical protein